MLHQPRFMALANEAKMAVEEISPAATLLALQAPIPPLLIDIREDHEWCTGHLPQALHLGKGIIERDIEKLVPQLNQPIILYCSGGLRSAIAAQALQQMGYTQVQSLQGGMRAWRAAGYPSAG